MQSFMLSSICAQFFCLEPLLQGKCVTKQKQTLPCTKA